MAKLRDVAVGRKDVYMIPPDKLIIDEGFNVRIPGDDLTQHIRNIADFIIENGTVALPPLMVIMDDDGPHVRDGHCRQMAVELAIKDGTPIESVPCMSFDRHSKVWEHIAVMMTRNQGKPLSTIEQMYVVDRLIKYGCPKDKIPERTGRTRTHINNLLTLSTATEYVHQAIKENRISATFTIELINKHGPDKAEQVIEQAIKSASQSGKPKATKKTVPRGTQPISWKKVGPPAVQFVKTFKEKMERYINELPAHIGSDISELLSAAELIIEDTRTKEKTKK